MRQPRFDVRHLVADHGCHRLLGRRRVASSTSRCPTISDLAKSIAAWIFIAGFVGIAPLLHVIGFMFGLIAVFRSNDNRLRGAFGLLFNSVAVAIGVGLVWLGLHALAAFT